MISCSDFQVAGDKSDEVSVMSLASRWCLASRVMLLSFSMQVHSFSSHFVQSLCSSCISLLVFSHLLAVDHSEHPSGRLSLEAVVGVLGRGRRISHKIVAIRILWTLPMTNQVHTFSVSVCVGLLLID